MDNVLKSISKKRAKELYDALSDEDKNICEEKMVMLQKALPIALMCNGGNFNLSIAYQLGSYSEEYCTKFGCSPAEYVRDLHMIKDLAIERLSSVETTHNKKEFKDKPLSNGPKAKHTSNLGAIMKDKGIV